MFIRNCNLRKSLGMGRLLEADSGVDGGGSTGEGDSTEGAEGESSEGEEVQTFDDILKDKKYQSEFDKRVQKALNTAKSKWEADSNTKIEEAKTEAEKLAKMTAEQKAKYAEDKRIKDLESRERDITTRELKATAYETLAEKGLPKDLVEILNYSDAESCNKSIEAVERAFQNAVSKAVNEKLRGKEVPKGGQGSKGIDAQLRNAFGV
ncbi:MAG: DUF4355 domain-containing protein [Clostridium sp.]|uniref:DUF4355 domain-containing protein n=1 Tax=Clostridium sp. TaxID=1506 RepID=UPI003F3A91D6